MTVCLLGLGSNVGDREATLAAALREMDVLPNVRLARRSAWYHWPPVGGPADQGEFLNAAAVVETTMPPLTLLDELQDIETRHGRQRSDRWAPRTLDIDILLCGNEVAEQDMLTLPHPRMSFRRFVLQPAVEVAPRMLHPVIGWPVERLLMHLDEASDQAAILSPSPSLRSAVAAHVEERFGGHVIERPNFATADQLWPPGVTTWVGMKPDADRRESPLKKHGGIPYAAAAFPKLSILLDAKSPPGAAPTQWSSIARRPGRGPTLRLQTADEAVMHAEVSAAIASVWPDLGPAGANRLE